MKNKLICASEGANDTSTESESNLPGVNAEQFDPERYLYHLKKWIGMRNVEYPVQETLEGLSFDFYHKPSRRFVKVFTRLDPYEILKYMALNERERVVLIIDAERCTGGHDIPASVLSASVQASAFIHHYDLLYKYSGKVNGACIWTPPKAQGDGLSLMRAPAKTVMNYPFLPECAEKNGGPLEGITRLMRKFTRNRGK